MTLEAKIMQLSSNRGEITNRKLGKEIGPYKALNSFSQIS